MATFADLLGLLPEVSEPPAIREARDGVGYETADNPRFVAPPLGVVEPR